MNRGFVPHDFRQIATDAQNCRSGFPPRCKVGYSGPLSERLNGKPVVACFGCRHRRVRTHSSWARRPYRLREFRQTYYDDGIAQKTTAIRDTFFDAPKSCRETVVAGNLRLTKGTAPQPGHCSVPFAERFLGIYVRVSQTKGYKSKSCHKRSSDPDSQTGRVLYLIY
jgi:hypothetical protein